MPLPPPAPDAMPTSPPLVRCGWCGTDPVYVAYHDQEWGRPLHDDVRLFELICLEGTQAGLSWITVLRRREAYRQAFHGFDPQRVAQMDAADMDRLMQDASLIRHRGKLSAVLTNAHATLRIQQRHGSLDAYLWQFVDGRPLVNHPASLADIPSSTPLSRQISRDLRQNGFAFVGETTTYALMQSAGLVNDHVVDCWCRSVALPQSSV